MSKTIKTENQTFTREQLEQMIDGSNFGYGTPIRDAARENADNYDYDSDTLDVVECVEDAFFYGACWALEHLK
jgi:hypothetical protein